MPAGLKSQSNLFTLFMASTVLFLSACSRDNPLSVPGEYISDPEAFCVENGPYSEFTLLDSIKISNILGATPENYPDAYDGETLNLESSFLLDNTTIQPMKISDYQLIEGSEPGQFVNTLVVLNKEIDSELINEFSAEELAEFDLFDPQVNSLSVVVNYTSNNEQLSQAIDEDNPSVLAQLTYGKNYFSTKVNASISVPRSFKDCQNPLTQKEIDDKDFKPEDLFKAVTITQEFKFEIERSDIDSFSGSELTSSAVLTENDRFGRVLAINDDFLVVGLPSEDSSGQGVFAAADFEGNNIHNENMQDSGAVYVFEKTGVNTWGFHSFIKASNSEAGDLFGTDVALNENRLIVSAPGEDSNASGIHLSANAQTDNAKVNNTAASSGAVYLFEFDTDERVWRETHYIKPQSNLISDGNYNKGFGSQLAILGNTMLIAAPLEDSENGGFSGSDYPDSGAVYVYKYSSAETKWGFSRALKALSPGSNDQFGYAVALSEKFIVVGAPFEDNETRKVHNNVGELEKKAFDKLITNNRTDSGAVYVYNYSQLNSEITLKTFLKSSNADMQDYFGTSVAISGSNLLVGAIGEDGSGKGLNRDMASNNLTDSGAAYLFQYDQTNLVWTQNTYIKGNDSQEKASFGRFIAMERTNVFISAPLFNTDNYVNAGKAYYYKFDGSMIAQDLDFQIAGQSNDLRYGSELAIFGRNLAIGASGYNDNQSGLSQPFVGTVFTFE